MQCGESASYKTGDAWVDCFLWWRYELGLCHWSSVCHASGNDLQAQSRWCGLKGMLQRE